MKWRIRAPWRPPRREDRPAMCAAAPGQGTRASHALMRTCGGPVRGGALALALCVTGACATSPPARYYTLNVIAPQARTTAAAQGAPIRVDQVTIPGELDRNQLVARTDANRVRIYGLARWAGPLDGMIRRVLSADLAERLPAGQVADPDEPQLGKRRQLFVDIGRFDADARCAVTLRAGWSLKNPAGGHLRATAHIHVPPAGACPAALPVGMSRALARLSAQIAARISGNE